MPPSIAAWAPCPEQVPQDTIPPPSHPPSPTGLRTKEIGGTAPHLTPSQAPGRDWERLRLQKPSLAPDPCILPPTGCQSFLKPESPLLTKQLSSSSLPIPLGRNSYPVTLQLCSQHIPLSQHCLPPHHALFLPSLDLGSWDLGLGVKAPQALQA